MSSRVCELRVGFLCRAAAASIVAIARTAASASVRTFVFDFAMALR